MKSNPFKELSGINKLQEQLAKDCGPAEGEVEENVNRFLLLYEALMSKSLPLDSRVLELGCGIGDWVAHLNKMGFDAYGVDIQEFWGEDYCHYWKSIEKPSHAYLDKLVKVNTDRYILPYPNEYHDFVFSDQVIEHVFDIESVFKETIRVLKPNGIQIHKFPGLNGAIERHTMLPFTRLTKYKTYIWLWAILGIRTNRQKGMSFREVYKTNIEALKHCYFLSKKECQIRLAKLNIDVYFVDSLEISLRSRGRIARLYRNTPKILKPLILKLLNPLIDSVMIIQKRS